MIYINTTGKQNQVWLPKPYDIVINDCPDADDAYNSGYTSGYTDGLEDGYGSGYTSGYTDGLNACSGGSCEGIWEEGYDSGYTDGQASVDCTDFYNSGKTDGIAEQKAKLTSTAFTSNGTYTRADGWSSVTVNVSGYTQEDLDAAYASGYTAGLDDCPCDPPELIIAENFPQEVGGYREVPSGGAIYTMTISGNTNWTAETIHSDCTLSRTSGESYESRTVTVTFPAILAGSDKYSLIEVHATPTPKTGYTDNVNYFSFQFYQIGSVPKILAFYPNDISDYDGTGGTFNLQVRAGEPYMWWNAYLEGGSSWCQISPSSGSGLLTNMTVTLEPYYESGMHRANTIIFTDNFGQEYHIEVEQVGTEPPAPSTTSVLDFVYETSGANQTVHLFNGSAADNNEFFYAFYSALTDIVIDNVSVGPDPDNIYVSQPRASDYYFYTFPTAGRHNVKFYVDNTFTASTQTGVAKPGSVLTDVIFINTSYSNTPIVEANIGEGYEEIKGGAFGNNGKLTDVSFPSTLLRLGYNPFHHTNIETLTIPDSVTSITDYDYAGLYATGSGPFNDCYSLTSVTLGSGLTLLSPGSFYNCSGLTELTVKAVTPPSIERANRNLFIGCTSLQHIYVPASSVNAYKAATGWSDYASIISAKP